MIVIIGHLDTTLLRSIVFDNEMTRIYIHIEKAFLQFMSAGASLLHMESLKKVPLVKLTCSLHVTITK